MLPSQRNDMKAAQSVTDAAPNNGDGNDLQGDKYSQNSKLTARSGRQTKVILARYQHRDDNGEGPIYDDGANSSSDSPHGTGACFWQSEAFARELAHPHVTEPFASCGVVGHKLDSTGGYSRNMLETFAIPL